jgi:hypothetical protein
LAYRDIRGIVDHFPWQANFSVLATDLARGLSLSR